LIVWGLTGGIATGKSTVAKMIEDEGVPVFDADRVAREIVEPDQPAWKQIVEAFSEKILAPDRTIDRTRLAAIVFADAGARKKLESFTHPRIREEIGQRILKAAGDGKDIAFVDAALMLETGWANDFAGVVVVDCPPALQLERLMKRDGLSEELAKRRIGAQMPLEEKKKKATFVIENDGSLVNVRRQVHDVLEKIRAEKK
jgi:dephospho-CoA kinase